MHLNITQKGLLYRKYNTLYFEQQNNNKTAFIYFEIDEIDLKNKILYERKRSF